jgi:isocitrate dehydrogenase
MEKKQTVVVIPGDGIGPAITQSVKEILIASGACLEFEDHKMGKDASLEEINNAMKAFERTGVMLKGPTETPVSTKGQKSFNVTARKGHGLFVNFRRSMSFDPIIKTSFPNQDITIFRENEEGLYSAVEHRHTPDGIQALSLKSESGMYKIIRAAFEYALETGKTKVSCLHKGNILKNTEGTFLEIFKIISADYPGIEAHSQIIDDGMAKVASFPENYQVIVTENLFGDILSDVTTQLTGSLGLGGSANIGSRQAMFEAIHGTGPDILPGGKLNPSNTHIANPSGLLQGAILMLDYIGGTANKKAAADIQNAWLWMLEDGLHTLDIARLKDGVPQNPLTKEVIDTNSFTNSMITRIKRIQTGHQPRLKSLQRLAYKHVSLNPTDNESIQKLKRTKPFAMPKMETKTVGFDVFIKWTGHEDPWILDTFARKSGTDLRDLLNLSHFSTLQEALEYTHWIHECLLLILSKNPELADKSFASPGLPSLIEELGFSSQVSELSDQAHKRSFSDLEQAFEIVRHYHQILVASITHCLGEKLESIAGRHNFRLEAVSCRGQSVYPHIMDPDLVDQMRCTFIWLGLYDNEASDKQIHKDILALLASIAEAGLDRAKTEELHEFRRPDGEWIKGYSDCYGQNMGTSPAN